MFSTNLKSVIRKTIVFSLGKLPRHWLLKQPKILFYHGVGENPNPLIETESISVQNFIVQLKYLKKYYNVISINEFYERFKKNDFIGNEVVLTFDDGYRNIITTALPILNDFNFPFSVFLTTDNISYHTLFPTTIGRLVILASSLQLIDLACINYKATLKSKEKRLKAYNEISLKLKTLPLKDVNRIICELVEQLPTGELEELRQKYNSIEPMNWDEASILSDNSLVTIGSHCVEHICCHDKQLNENLQIQFQKSRDEICSKLNCECNILSYPNGNFTNTSNDIAKEIGYKFALSTKRKSIFSEQNKTWFVFPRLYVPYNFDRFVYSLITYPY